ncbi:hypothetical protein [Kluyvera sichuanensis]|uniref:Tail fiber assembly protein n=1 Tax=Kluyvera sichuanensis TaxID=2725494 RepID=A0ABR6S1I5_9ENTR|nr:hypothetical protein [Kluyvera sichuanensis]MBC1189268.1 hypothetical protein [Kluyvera sichuanensis]
MTDYIYSPSINMFYPNALKNRYLAAGAWPDDGIEVSTEMVIEFTTDRPGWVRVAGSDGLPAWTEAPVPTIPDTQPTQEV